MYLCNGDHVAVAWIPSCCFGQKKQKTKHRLWEILQVECMSVGVLASSKLPKKTKIKVRFIQNHETSSKFSTPKAPVEAFFDVFHPQFKKAIKDACAGAPE